MVDATSVVDALGESSCEPSCSTDAYRGSSSISCDSLVNGECNADVGSNDKSNAGNNIVVNGFNFDIDCIDDDYDNFPYCASWHPSECEKNPDYMLPYCKKSCNACNDIKQKKLSQEHDGTDDEYDDLGIIQQVHFDEGVNDAITTQQLQDHVQDARDYMANVRRERSLDERVLDMCKLKHEHCALWSLQGECEKNPSYMKVYCAPVCQVCHYLTVEGRCLIDPDAPVAWKPHGDLDNMFRRLSSEPYLSLYGVQILSSPDIDEDHPWVITMENVVSDVEADRLIELGAIEGYKRSTDVGDVRADGTTESVTSEGRTSTNAWCQNECYEDPTAQAVIQRLSILTGIDETNSEHLQLLRYEVGQKYELHHDYVDLEVNRQQGPRILTVYLYLNDVKAGGGTNFPGLDITCMPKRGRALIWPSVLDDDPFTIDPRTFHQALPVEAGIKYGANAWFHLRDFKTPNENNCQ